MHEAKLSSINLKSRRMNYGHFARYRLFVRRDLLAAKQQTQKVRVRKRAAVGLPDYDQFE